MAHSYIGKPISLISHSDVRYRGILAGIDPHASTIQLSNVYSMGTETRRPQAQFIPPVPDPYAYIIFRASEVKDLSVDEPAAAQPPPPQANIHADPAIIGVAAGPQAPYNAYPAANGAAVPAPAANNQPAQPAQPYPQGQAPVAAATAPHTQAPQQHQQTQPQQVPQPAQNAPRGGQSRRDNAVRSATTSLETVERAIGDLRTNGASTQPAVVHGGRGGGPGRRGGHRGGPRGDAEQIKVPTTDFDFESMNAKFDKAAISVKEDGSTTGDVEDAEKPAEKEPPAYNPQKSFFDSLSSSASTPNSGPQAERGGGHQGGGRGRRGGPGGGRNRREEEREKNVATFGEPGGVGLLGPGAYVGGWGGYGRRGGRPRRGAGGPGGAGRGGGGSNPTVQARV
ncbi:Scd6-like Sm domain-containing protein [Panaeolus papilionaceus]|nr:Scd6-like Sm domain-containing protein [Panaeolus papilionaceus]